ncbi:hypothetical protein PHISCL_10376, partial [Aspergillus sclerotialis]
MPAPRPIAGVERRAYGSFLDIVVWVCIHRAVHRANTRSETQADHQPRVRSHQSVTPAAGVQCPGRKTDDPDAQTGVHKCLVQVFPLKGRHAAIFACFAVKDQVRGDNGSADQRSAVQEPLREVATRGGVRGL